MNLPLAKTTLEKIITLYKTMSADEKNISSIERDLMLSYIRQLYEHFLEPNQGKSSASPAPSPKVMPPKPPVQEPTVMQNTVVQAPVPPTPEPIVYQAPPPPPVPEPVVYQAPPPPPIPEPVKYQAPPPPKVENVPPPPFSKPASSASTRVTPEIAALFEDTSGKELSDKLSNTPIADLTKAFGLNDRLLTQNELFGGNKPVFEEAIKDLNNMSSYETAKGFMYDLAARYSWSANEDRKKQARAFIKLVRRRLG